MQRPAFDGLFLRTTFGLQATRAGGFVDWQGAHQAGGVDLLGWIKPPAFFLLYYRLAEWTLLHISRMTPV